MIAVERKITAKRAARIEWAERLRAAGKSVPEIAKEMGCNKSCVYKYLNPISRPRESIEVRFERLWEKDDSGCFAWIGSKCQGYGRFSVKGVAQPAHRVALELAGTPVPKGTHVDHLCRNPSCVNPDHLEVVTPAENQRRGINTKLTTEQVRAARIQFAHSRLTAQKFGRQYADRFGVSARYLEALVGGLNWREVKA